MIYGKQLTPLMHEIAKRGGSKISTRMEAFFQRAIGRAMLSQLEQ